MLTKQISIKMVLNLLCYIIFEAVRFEYFSFPSFCSHAYITLPSIVALLFLRHTQSRLSEPVELRIFDKLSVLYNDNVELQRKNIFQQKLCKRELKQMNHSVWYCSSLMRNFRRHIFIRIPINIVLLRMYVYVTACKRQPL